MVKGRSLEKYQTKVIVSNETFTRPSATFSFRNVSIRHGWPHFSTLVTKLKTMDEQTDRQSDRQTRANLKWGHYNEITCNPPELIGLRSPYSFSKSPLSSSCWHVYLLSFNLFVRCLLTVLYGLLSPPLL